MSTKSSLTPIAPGAESAALRIELRPSRILRGALIALAAIVLMAIYRAALPHALQGALGALLVIHLLYSLRRETRCSGLLSWRSGQWLWMDGHAREHRLYLRAATAWRVSIVLRFREQDGGAQVFTLLPDSAARDALRRLRVGLRHMPVFEGDDAS